MESTNSGRTESPLGTWQEDLEALLLGFERGSTSILSMDPTDPNDHLLGKSPEKYEFEAVSKPPLQHLETPPPPKVKGVPVDHKEEWGYQDTGMRTRHRLLPRQQVPGLPDHFLAPSPTTWTTRTTCRVGWHQCVG